MSSARLPNLTYVSTDPLEWRIRANDPSVSPREIATDNGVYVVGSDAPFVTDLSFVLKLSHKTEQRCNEKIDCGEHLRRWTSSTRADCVYTCHEATIHGTFYEVACTRLDVVVDRAIMSLLSAFGFDATSPFEAVVDSVAMDSSTVHACLDPTIDSSGGDDLTSNMAMIIGIVVLTSVMIVASVWRLKRCMTSVSTSGSGGAV
jgi:hypothetical protein